MYLWRDLSANKKKLQPSLRDKTATPPFSISMIQESTVAT
jgi:hypothetical protein